jgi:hypothetical protein
VHAHARRRVGRAAGAERRLLAAARATRTPASAPGANAYASASPPRPAAPAGAADAPGLAHGHAHEHAYAHGGPTAAALGQMLDVVSAALAATGQYALEDGTRRRTRRG